MKVQGLTIDRLAVTEVASLVLAALCMLGQAAAQPFSCGVDARPHPKGVCGETLIRAHTNLCRLLSIDFPDHFGRGRLVKKSVQELFSYPVHAFAKLDLQGKETADAYEGLGTPALSPAADGAGVVTGSEAGDSGFSDDLSRRAQRLSLLRAGSRPYLRSADDVTAVGRQPDASLSHAQKRGMVCDCCFNQCLPSTLARYCS